MVYDDMASEDGLPAIELEATIQECSIELK